MAKTVKKSKALKSKRLEKRMAAYSAAAASALAASQAEATIFWFTNGVHFTAAQGDVGDFENFDFDFVIGGNSHVFRLAVSRSTATNSITGVVPATWTNTRYRFAFITSFAGSGTKSIANSGFFAARLPSGASTTNNFYSLGFRALGTRTEYPIYRRFATGTGSTSFTTTNPSSNPPSQTGPWPGNRGFARLRLNLGGTNYYGWAELSVDLSNPAAGVVVHQWAYSDIPNDNLAAGAIPEPGTLWSLAAGAAGLIAWRTKRRKQAAKTA